MFEEGGADCSFTLPQEAQSAEGKADLTGECGHVEAEQAELAKLASELAAEKARVVQLEEKVAKLNADVERVSQGAEAARIALATAESQAALECQAKLALASGMQFIDSLRALLGQPAPAPSLLEPRQLRQACQGPDGGANLADGLATGPLHSGAPGALGRATKEEFPGVSLVECSAAAGEQDPKELAGNRTALADFFCTEDLDGEEQALIQRFTRRLIEEKNRGANSGRTLWSITTKIFGMSQRDLDRLVDAYNTFGLYPPASAGAADAGGPGADAAAGDPGDTHSAAGAHDMLPTEPASGGEFASGGELPSAQPEPDGAVEPPASGGGPASAQPEPDGAAEPSRDSVAVYCEVCVIWLNGPKQYEQHSIGRKHRKRERDRSRAKSPVPLAPVDDAPGGCSSSGKVFQ